MNDKEIRKTAGECGLEAEFDLTSDEVVVQFWSGSVEKFYRAAYNKGVEDATQVADAFVDATTRKFMNEAIRALEMK